MAGFVLDKQGHVLTNYHVLQSVLKGLGDSPNGKRVARVTLLRPDGVQQTYDATLVREGGRGCARCRFGGASPAGWPRDVPLPLAFPLSGWGRPRP